MKNEYFVLVSIISFVYIINIVKKGKFSITESIFWSIASVMLIIFAIFPKILDRVALRLGIAYPPSLLFLICILFLIFINFRISRKLGIAEEKIAELAQRIALLEEKE